LQDEVKTHNTYEQITHLINSIQGWSNERIYITEKVDTRGIKRKIVSLDLSVKRWWTLGLPLARQHYESDLELVDQAYIEIGAKVTDASIMYAKVRLQQAHPTQAYKFNNAINIARVMRCLNLKRDQELAVASSAISSTQ